MKSKKEEVTTRTFRNTYTASFKEPALERADKEGIPKVAQDLGLAEGRHYMPGGQNIGKRGNRLKTKSSSKSKWQGSSVKTPDWKRKWPS